MDLFNCRRFCATIVVVIMKLIHIHLFSLLGGVVKDLGEGVLFQEKW